MSRQGAPVNLRASSWRANSLGDVKDDTGEAIFIEVNLLMIGNLTDGAVFMLAGVVRKTGLKTCLTSAKVEGRSTTRAPPKRGVLVNVAIVFYVFSGGGELSRMLLSYYWVVG